MRFEEKTIVLKDGTQAILRAPRKEDAQPLLDFLLAIAEETEFTLRYPEECAGITLEQEERYIQSLNDSETDYMIICEINGEIAGNCGLKLNGRMKIRHRAGIAIALYKKHWGKGIGTALFREMIALGEKHGLHQLELEYVEGNDRGRVLYEKMGFEIFGKRPDAFRLKDGSLRDEVLMVKKLNA